MRIDRECFDSAFRQFDLDFHISGGEWVAKNVHLSPVKRLEGSRIHCKLDPFFKAAIVLGKAYVMADERMHPWICKHLCKVPPEWWCDFKVLRSLDREIQKYDKEIFDTHIYFLPSVERTDERAEHEVRWFEEAELEQFREDNRFNKYALSFSPTQPDVLAVAAYDKNEIIGMAGCSADGEYLWQIGVDVCPEYAGKGLGRDLVTLLKKEILARGKTPYYGTAESHAVSRNIAIGSGFLPAWCEITVRSKQEEVAD